MMNHNYLLFKSLHSASFFNSESDGKPEDSKKLAKRKNSSKWKWGGCSHNLDFGVEYSQSFLDSREKAGDIQSRINLHNNEAGRLVSSMCPLGESVIHQLRVNEMI